MLLVVDIGNTNIVFGLFDEDVLLCQFRMSANPMLTADECAAFLLPMLAKHCPDTTQIKAVSIASVVPLLLSCVQRFLERYISNKIYVIGHDNHNLQIMLAEPHRLGKDLIANAIAAYALYGTSCLIVDIGTALTFSFIEVKNDAACYIGGAITPGPGTMLRALNQNTAQLPNIPFTAATSVCGKNTIAALTSGVYFGCIGLVEGVITRFQNEMHTSFNVVMTGGVSSVLANKIRFINVVEPNLTLLGLRFFYLQKRECLE